MRSINEIWKDVTGYKGYYQVSNLGNVKSLDREVWNGKVYHLKLGQSLKNNLTENGYHRVSFNKQGKSKTFLVHQIVAMMFLDHEICGFEKVIDHINMDRTDNRAENLRILTNRENVSAFKRGTSKYTGVHFHKTTKKWCANIFSNGNKKYLGSFKTEIEAYNAYQKQLNIILCQQ